MDAPFIDHAITKEQLLKQLNSSWFERIPGLESRPYWNSIVEGMNDSLRIGHPAMPKLNRIFYALNEFDASNFRVLIIGQDPYPTIGAANGLAFATYKKIRIQKSLDAIFKEIDDEYGSDMRVRNEENGSLLSWMKQGVLLLNATLTIGTDNYQHRAIGWKSFTNEIIQYLDAHYRFVTIAMGADAREIAKLNITENLDSIIITKHPMVRDNTFAGNNAFIQCNDKLMEKGLSIIRWVY